MPYADPEKARAAKRESARRRRDAKGSTAPSRPGTNPDTQRRLQELEKRLTEAEQRAARAEAFITEVSRRVGRDPADVILWHASRAAREVEWPHLQG